MSDKLAKLLFNSVNETRWWEDQTKKQQERYRKQAREVRIFLGFPPDAEPERDCVKTARDVLDGVAEFLEYTRRNHDGMGYIHLENVEQALAALKGIIEWEQALRDSGDASTSEESSSPWVDESPMVELGMTENLRESGAGETK
jgi:hypothetical protein